MKLSFKVLSISADALGMDMDEPESKFEKWLAKTFGDKVMNAIMGVAGFLGVVLGIGLFLVLPTLATKGLDMLLGLAGGALGVFKTLCEGLIRIGIFVGYILLVSLMPDIRRTFEYHGAEHKSIACYEAGVADPRECKELHAVSPALRHELHLYHADPERAGLLLCHLGQHLAAPCAEAAAAPRDLRDRL